MYPTVPFSLRFNGIPPNLFDFSPEPFYASYGSFITLIRFTKALLEPLCDIEGSGFSKANLKDAIKGIVDSRNYYTHYDPALYKVAMRDEQLAKLNRRLTKALRYYILKLLGLSESVAKERVGYGITPQCKVVGEEYAFGVGG